MSTTYHHGLGRSTGHTVAVGDVASRLPSIAKTSEAEVREAIADLDNDDLATKKKGTGQACRLGRHSRSKKRRGKPRQRYGGACQRNRRLPNNKWYAEWVPWTMFRYYVGDHSAPEIRNPP
jgi:hypothetical protein